jgi:O-antigen/teichoic acid export membrane protein
MTRASLGDSERLDSAAVNSGPSREAAPPLADARRAAPLRRASLRLNALASMFSNLVYFGVVFLVTPIAIRHLGADGWGIFQLVGATAIYAQLLNLSLGTATHYQVAYRTARGDFDGLATVFTNVRLYLLGVSAVLVSGALLLGRPFVASLVEPEQVDLAFAALAIGIGITSIDIHLRIAGSVLIGLQRNDLYSIYQTLGAGLLFAGVVVGFRLGMDLRGFTAVMTLGPSVAALCSWLTYRRILPPASLRYRKPDWALFREMVGYSLSTIIYASGAAFLYQTMKLVASWRCGGPEAAGHMGLALSLAQTLSVVFTPLVGVLHSRVGQFHGERRLDQVPPLLERTFAVLGLLLVPAVVFLVIAAPAVFEAWVGSAVDDAVLARLAATTRLLLVGHAFFIAALPFYYALLGVGEHRVFGTGMFCVAIVNAALGWFVAGVAPRIEALGAVYGVLMLVLVSFVTAPAGLRRFPIALRPLFSRSLLSPLLAVAPGALALLLRPRLGQPLLDLAADGIVFLLCSLPGLEWVRRRHGIPLRFGLGG